MKRFHVHMSVADLAESVGFYSRLFGVQPTVLQTDYAKWLLDDPRINFAISQRGRRPGVNHLGFQVDSERELATLRERVAAAGIAADDEKEAACCYAKSDKYWIEDPQGVAWETFHTLGSIPVYGLKTDRACCTPETAPGSACC